jgi:murein DD-endopeptidase MepM/ murein hydrolase activator NlpD
MKLSTAALSAVVLVFIAFPVLFATGDAPGPNPVGCFAPGTLQVDMGAILATVRARESGADYTAHATGSTASGAYQFVDGTWAGYGGYPSAGLAPPGVQDAKAAEHVKGILDANHGDVTTVPVVWYIGYVPSLGDPAWDRVPGPAGVNRLTPRQYQAQWLVAYRQQLADAPSSSVASPPSALPGSAVTTGCAVDGRGTEVAGGWAYPGPADLFAHATVDNPHHDYPAWDWPIPEGTTIYAVHGGQVASISTWARNWYDQPCRPGERCSRCGVGVTIVDAQGARWNYCHGTQLDVDVGETVAAGTPIMTSGNTGRSTTPHLHLGIRTADGQARCPQPLLASLRDRSAALDPADLPTSGCIG